MTGPVSRMLSLLEAGPAKGSLEPGFLLYPILDKLQASFFTDFPGTHGHFPSK